ncbi:MAG: transcriptional repressor, partial [Alphaproteobacteria bacterium]|nr:transcriptional repressor [Alphaproteobacteria bacterium]
GMGKGIINSAVKASALMGRGVMDKDNITDRITDSNETTNGVLSRVALIGLLASRGINPTAPRIMVAAWLFRDGKHRHTTAEEIFKDVKKKQSRLVPDQDWRKDQPHATIGRKKGGVSLASVYNVLNLFVEKKLLAICNLPPDILPDQKRSTVIYDTNLIPHHHVVDTTNGKIYDLPLAMIKLDQLVASADQQIKKNKWLPRTVWLVAGRRKKLSLPPMTFVLGR